jgi:hypothetical protein
MVESTPALPALLLSIAHLDHAAALGILDAAPSLTTATMARRDEFFLTERMAQVYEGDTALHAAGFSYDSDMARELIARGADVSARNRRHAEPLHAAVTGVPGSPSWNPVRQREVILCLIEAGANPNATATGGVTPLHRAVRTDVRLPSKPSCSPVPILTSKTTAVRPRPTSLTGRLVAAAQAPRRPSPSSESFAHFLKSRPDRRRFA